MKGRAQYLIIAIIIGVIGVLGGLTIYLSLEQPPQRVFVTNTSHVDYWATSQLALSYERVISTLHEQAVHQQVDPEKVRLAVDLFSSRVFLLTSPQAMTEGRRKIPGYDSIVGEIEQVRRSIDDGVNEIDRGDMGTIPAMVNRLQALRNTINDLNMTGRLIEEQVAQDAQKLSYRNRSIVTWLSYAVFLGFTILVVVIWKLWQQQATLARERSTRLRLAEEAKQLAEGTARAKSQFLATVSHDLRSPLQAILSAASLLEYRNPPPAGRRPTEVIRDACYQLTRLVDDLVDLGRLENQQLRLIPEPFALPLWLQTLAEDFQRRAAEKDLSFDVVTGALPAAIEFDRARLSQMTSNLLSNAIKFTPSGHISLEVAFTADESATSGSLSICVRDTGRGIPVADQQRIFDPFTQLINASDTRDGMGLGLAIVARLAKLANGSIVVASTSGVGSTFTVQLPVRVASLPLAVPAERRFAPRTTAGYPTAPRVLLAEDDAVLRDILYTLIEDMGFACDRAIDGKAALELVHQHRYSAVVTDLQMPNIDGFALAAQLRQLAACPPIIAITAYTAALAAEEGSDLFDYLLSKPVERGELLHALESLVDGPQGAASEHTPG